jgi:NAD+ synthase
MSGFSPDILKLDAAAETDRIASFIKEQVVRRLRRRGAVIGLSGGIDSSVAAALSVRALGPERVTGLLMPEQDSSPDSLRLGRELAEFLGIASIVEDMTPILTACGCYQRRDAAIRTVIPEYNERCKSKIVLPGIGPENRYSLFSVVAQTPSGKQIRARLTAEAYRAIVAATNFKQRARKMMEYHYADLLHYAVVGTPNRLEFDQGFFVKNGDGAADLKPIAHLYKTQVFDLAAYLGLPEEIQQRPSSTDTYSLEQSQEEFFFSIPLKQLDLCLYARDHGVPPEQTAEALGMSAAEAQAVYNQIDSKRKATRYLHCDALQPDAAISD